MFFAKLYIVRKNMHKIETQSLSQYSIRKLFWARDSMTLTKYLRRANKFSFEH